MRTAEQMRKSDKRIFVKTVLVHSKNERDNDPGGHSVEVHGEALPPKEFASKGSII
jgi:hypothetical protein